MNVSYQYYKCLLNYFFKTSDRGPTMRIEPGNILLVGRENFN